MGYADLFADRYRQLVSVALDAPFSGWDFSWLRDRTHSADLPWSYADRARALFAHTDSLLDLDTGGGEHLASLRPLPPRTAATEAHLPNIAVARDRLRSLGVEVRPQSGDRLPAADAEFGLVLDRHGVLDAAEIHRVLRPGGRFLTQQVGSSNCAEINDALGTPLAEPESWTLAVALEQLRGAGLSIIDAEEVWVPFTFYDIAAVIYQLRAVPWQVAGFDVDRYDQELRQLHEHIEAAGEFVAYNHRFLIEAAR